MMEIGFFRNKTKIIMPYRPAAVYGYGGLGP